MEPDLSQLQGRAPSLWAAARERAESLQNWEEVLGLKRQKNKYNVLSDADVVLFSIITARGQHIHKLPLFLYYCGALMTKSNTASWYHGQKREQLKQISRNR